jgi:hypothetical protein
MDREGAVTPVAPNGGRVGVDGRSALVGTCWYISEAVAGEPTAGELVRYASRHRSY